MRKRLNGSVPHAPDFESIKVSKFAFWQILETPLQSSINPTNYETPAKNVFLMARIVELGKSECRETVVMETLEVKFSSLLEKQLLKLK